jgi:TonB family protein
MTRGWDISQELTRLAVLSRSIMALMLGHEPLPFVSVTADVGDSRNTIDASGDPDALHDCWKKFDSVAGDQIIAALRKKITDMPSGLQISFWIGTEGRVAVTRIDRSSGDAGIDDIAENQVLRNMQFIPPPADMPMPLVLSVTITPSGWIYSLDRLLQ